MEANEVLGVVPAVITHVGIGDDGKVLFHILLANGDSGHLSLTRDNAEWAGESFRAAVRDLAEMN
jgi:hypothetical protein